MVSSAFEPYLSHYIEMEDRCARPPLPTYTQGDADIEATLVLSVGGKRQLARVLVDRGHRLCGRGAFSSLLSLCV
jgi:hypothetical protein